MITPQLTGRAVRQVFDVPRGWDMRLKIMGVGLIVGASFLPGRAQAQVAAGCFDVSLGEWSPIDSTHVVDLPRPSPPDQSGDSVSYLIPPRLRLHDDRTARRSAEAFLVSVPPNALQVPHPFLSWTGASDSLRIALSTGYSGTISTLYPTTDGWTGSARTFSDVRGVLRYERPMTLHRVACESEPPVPASADRPLPRSVELREHETLALGQPLPSGAVAQPRRSGAKTLEVEVAGIWAGADTVVVRIDEKGVVFHIEMRYPDGFDLSPLMQALLHEFGAGRTLREASSTRWRNRTTIMFADPRRPRILIRDPRYDW